MLNICFVYLDALVHLHPNISPGCILTFAMQKKKRHSKVRLIVKIFLGTYILNNACH